MSFPGQQIIRLPDGRLQLITIPQQQQQQQATTAQVAQTAPPVVTQIATAARPVQVQPQVSIRPQTMLIGGSTGVVTVPATVQSPALVTPTKVIVPSQPGVAVSSSPNLTSTGMTIISSPQSSGTVSVLTSSGGQTLAKIFSPAAKGPSQVVQKISNTPVLTVNTAGGQRIIRQVTMLI